MLRAAAMLCLTFLVAAAGVLLKIGIAKAIPNLEIAASLGLYAVTAIAFTALLKHGQVSVLFPMFALGYVWTGIAAAILLNEPIGLVKAAGIVLIALGVAVLALK